MTYPIRTIVFVIAMLSGGVFQASTDAVEADGIGVEITRDGPTIYSFSVIVDLREALGKSTGRP